MDMESIKVRAMFYDLIGHHSDGGCCIRVHPALC